MLNNNAASLFSLPARQLETALSLEFLSEQPLPGAFGEECIFASHGCTLCLTGPPAEIITALLRCGAGRA